MGDPSANGHKRLVVVDYGVNNVGSVVNMLRRLDVEADLVRNGDGIAGATAIVLPGIGAFDSGVTNLKRTGLFDAIRERVAKDRVPILGICLGMQLLSNGSEEGSLEGLGLLPARTTRFEFDAGSSQKVPHMGWNETECVDDGLFGGFGSERPRFYYVHSYHVVCEDEADVAARCSYGITFTAAVRRGHVYGTQFHPEKSHRFGMQVLGNFARLTGHA
jgi:glutamine amidotransferase